MTILTQSSLRFKGIDFPIVNILAGNVLCLAFFWPVKSKTGHDMSQTCLQMSRDISFLVGKIHKLWKKDGAIFCSLDPKKEPSSIAASIFVIM